MRSRTTSSPLPPTHPPSSQSLRVSQGQERPRYLITAPTITTAVADRLICGVPLDAARGELSECCGQLSECITGLRQLVRRHGQHEVHGVLRTRARPLCQRNVDKSSKTFLRAMHSRGGRVLTYAPPVATAQAHRSTMRTWLKSRLMRSVASTPPATINMGVSPLACQGGHMPLRGPAQALRNKTTQAAPLGTPPPCTQPVVRRATITVAWCRSPGLRQAQLSETGSSRTPVSQNITSPSDQCKIRPHSRNESTLSRHLVGMSRRFPTSW